jgi:methylmalonyl-CoA/ethylmalonyl-CoA epimerase
MTKSPPSDFGLGPIGQIAIPVRDIDRAVVFYRDVLKMQFLFQAPPGLGFFNCQGVRLMLDALAKDNAGKASVVYYQVIDIQSAFETFSSRGIIFESKPHFVARMPDHEVWMAFFRDPDRNMLALMSEVVGSR